LLPKIAGWINDQQLQQDYPFATQPIDALGWDFSSDSVHCYGTDRGRVDDIMFCAGVIKPYLARSNARLCNGVRHKRYGRV